MGLVGGSERYTGLGAVGTLNAMGRVAAIGGYYRVFCPGDRLIPISKPLGASGHYVMSFPSTT